MHKIGTTLMIAIVLIAAASDAAFADKKKKGSEGETPKESVTFTYGGPIVTYTPQKSDRIKPATGSGLGNSNINRATTRH